MKILAIDPGLASLGYVVMQKGPVTTDWVPVAWGVLKTTENKGVLNIRASHDLIRRAQEQARGLTAITQEHGIKCVISEMYDTAAKSAAALRSMMITLGMLAAWSEPYAVEWYSPWDTRRAADVPSHVHGPAVKKHVIAVMGKRYPFLLEMPMNKAEHIADALAAFEAARNGMLLKSV